MIDMQKLLRVSLKMSTGKIPPTLEERIFWRLSKTALGVGNHEKVLIKCIATIIFHQTSLPFHVLGS
jgi:hypothetical protein